MNTPSTLFPVPGRILVLAWLIPFLFAPGYELTTEITFELFGLVNTDYWYDIIYYLYFHALSALVIVACLLIGRVNWQRWFSTPSANSIPPAVEITLLVLVFSMASTYWLFYPLSLIFPNFVQFWLLDLPSLIIWDSASESYPLIPNALSFTSLVILAPILEEVVFRGLMLQRWASKYGTFIAVLLSSAVFAMTHTDPPGAFVFGIAMSYLYIRSQSLWLPILCHALNNFIVWLWSLGDTLYYGPGRPYAMAEFHSEWPYAILFSVLTLAWSYRVLPKIPSIRSWRAARI